MVRAVIFFLTGMLAMPVAADNFMMADGITQPVTARFSICYNHSCINVATDSISEEEWRRATAPFSRGANTAAEERAVIADSIAILEKITGMHLGTSVDKGGNLAGFGRPKQLDCIDESTNTNTTCACWSGMDCSGFTPLQIVRHVSEFSSESRIQRL